VEEGEKLEGWGGNGCGGEGEKLKEGYMVARDSLVRMRAHRNVKHGKHTHENA
jgi:hypothetical protein